MWSVICILLLSVASNGVIGSIDDLPEDCAACLKGSCRSVSGLYTKPDLPQGYSVIAQIPGGACRIIVQQLKHTKNNIALRNANGSYIINGEWKFGPSRTVEGAGTRFIYQKQDGTSLETVTSSGPVSNPIDIMIVTQQPNLGVKYGYSIPLDTETKEQIAPPFLKQPTNTLALQPRRLDIPVAAASQHDEAIAINNNNHKRRIRRRFSWKVSGVSSCTKSCDGGIQTTTYSCIREHTQTSVSEKRCSHLDKPVPQQIRCNTQPCPAHWVGVWGPCAGSCGKGIQNYVLYCQQANPVGQMMILSDGACTETKPRSSSRPCNLSPCLNEPDNELHETREDTASSDEWIVGTWTQCSASCGTGQRTRSVTCPTGKCLTKNRPMHAEYCDAGACSLHGQVSPWLVSEWSQCSEACGTGTQSRLALCNKEVCESSTKPETARACSSERFCIGQWFVGPWGSCPESCVTASKQTREVFCIVKTHGQSRITNEMTCSIQEKPVSERLCHGSCPARWYVGEWGACEGSCPTRSQWREVRCKDVNGGNTNECQESERPISKRSCSCEKQDLMNQPAHDEPQDSNCIDKITNCYLAVQARLCHYPYYISNCCVSCSKSPQQIVESK